MKTSIKFINHASVIISGKKTVVLTDPWYEGDAFNKGWNLITETTDGEIDATLNIVTHIWLSHEHPDHFSISFFKKFKNKIKEKKIKILFQKTKDKRVISFIKQYNLDFIELDFNKKINLDNEFSVLCIKDGFYDSALLVYNKNEKILNLNDCDISTPNRATEVFKVTGAVDVLLTQFSFAAWKGGKGNVKWRNDSAREKLETINLQIKYFLPKIVIPFASFIYFSNNDNFYLNDAINTPKNVSLYFKNISSKVIFMKPQDKIGGDNEYYSNNKAVEYWEKLYSSLNSKKVNVYDTISEIEIKRSYEAYCNRILERNSLILMKLIKFLIPISFFRPVIIEVYDLNKNFKIDYLSRKIELINKKGMLKMNSACLNFLFKNTFGFDTLTVNGCFEEVSKNGFLNATKTLAIENLNNLGIYITIRNLLSFYVIKLFLTKLYRVARKLGT